MITRSNDRQSSQRSSCDRTLKSSTDRRATDRFSRAAEWYRCSGNHVVATFLFQHSSDFLVVRLLALSRAKCRIMHASSGSVLLFNITCQLYASAYFVVHCWADLDEAQNRSHTRTNAIDQSATSALRQSTRTAARHRCCARQSC